MLEKIQTDFDWIGVCWLNCSQTLLFLARSSNALNYFIAHLKRFVAFVHCTRTVYTMTVRSWSVQTYSMRNKKRMRYCIVHDRKYNVDGMYSMNTTNLFPRWFILFRLEEEVTKTPKNCRIWLERKAIIVQNHFTCWPMVWMLKKYSSYFYNSLRLYCLRNSLLAQKSVRGFVYTVRSA
jgi:hypothetical protein